jgi:hypothetical protein
MARFLREYGDGGGAYSGRTIICNVTCVFELPP